MLWWISIAKYQGGAQGIIVTEAPTREDAVRKFCPVIRSLQADDVIALETDEDSTKGMPRDRLITKQEFEQFRSLIRPTTITRCPNGHAVMVRDRETL